MSSTSSLSRGNVTFSSADLVQGQITSVDNQISGLSDDLKAMGNAIQQLVAQLQGMEPPTAPGSPDDETAMAAYQQQLQAYHAQVNSLQNQINTLNEQSKELAQRISQLQSKVQQMESSDLPNAQRQDQQRQDDELKQMRDTYEQQAKTADAGSSVSDQADKTDLKRQQATRISDNAVQAPSDGSNSNLQLRVSWKNFEVSDSSSLKTLVRAFQLQLAMAGDGTDVARRNNTAVAMPYTPGTGLPPVGTP